jgi:MarR family transcriptional regulator, organic hydroperoxide resistance regulator
LKSARGELTVTKRELLIDGSDNAFRHLVHDLLAFSARIQEIRNGLAEVIGLTGTQYTVLISISRSTGSAIGINKIAEELHLSAAFITIAVNVLVKMRLVKKKVNREDRRRVLLTLTPEGQTLLSELATVQRPVNDALFECLGAEDFRHLQDTMPRLVGSAERAIRLITFIKGGGSI